MSQIPSKEIFIHLNYSKCAGFPVKYVKITQQSYINNHNTICNNVPSVYRVIVTEVRVQVTEYTALQTVQTL